MKIKTVVVSCFAIAVASLFLFGSCSKAPANSADSFTFDKDTSYSMGMLIAAQNQIPNVHYDYKSFMEGFRDYTEAVETRLSIDEAIGKIQSAFTAYESIENEKASAESNRNLDTGRAYLSENSRRPGVVTTSSGLQYEVITEGTGIKPLASDYVRVHYEGKLIDGTVFDSSYMRNEPAEFPLNGVIPGWTEGVQLMSEGSVYMLYLPPDLAYGPNNMGTIPGNSTLIFKVELLSVLRY